MIFASFFGICRRDDSVFEPVPSRSNAGGSVLDCITQTSSTAKEAATIVTLSAVSSNKGAASGDVDRTDRPLDARSGNDAQLLKSGGRSCNPRYDAERLRGSWHPGAKPDRFNAMQLGQKFGYPLATLGYSVLRDVANELGLPLTQLEAFCLAVDLYMPKNDYHNRLHVADVVQLMHLQCSEGGELNACLTITNLDRHISLT